MAEFGELVDLATKTAEPLDFETANDVFNLNEVDMEALDLKKVEGLRDLVKDKLGGQEATESQQKLADTLEELAEKKKTYELDKINEAVEGGLTEPETVLEVSDAINDIRPTETGDMKTEMKGVDGKIRSEVNKLDPADAEKIVDKGIESVEEASGETIGDDIKEQIKKASKEVVDDIDGKLKKAEKILNEKMKNLNDKIAEGAEEGKSLSETVKDIFKGLVEVLKILGPIFGMWFMFNLISYVFSECYWIPVNKNCKFYDSTGKELEDWGKLQHTKKRMNKRDTQKSFYARLTFQKSDNPAQCACNSAADSVLEVVKNTEDRYGHIQTNKGVGEPCNNDTNGNTIACYERSAGDKPMCLTSHKSEGNPDENRRAKISCGGYYKKYDCNLGEMINSFARLVDMVAHTNPLDLIKKIIYIIVAIIVVFFVISIVRYMLQKKSE